jgi:predicted nucleic acid-binding protein
VIVLDTTVLVYAAGVDHPLRDPCRQIFAAVVDRRVEASTTVEVIQEFAHVRARRRGRVDATALSLDYAELLAPLITVTPEDLRAGLALFAGDERLGAFDAVLAATAAARQATAIVSADRAFAAAAPALRHVTPDARGVADLLAR